MRDAFSTFIAATGAAIYTRCDEQFQTLPPVLQSVLYQQKKAALFVMGAMLPAMGKVVSPVAIKNYAGQALTALPNFLSYCNTDSKAPRIFYISQRLLVDDFLPVFLATYFYHLAQYAYQSHKENIPESAQSVLDMAALFLTATLFIFSFLRKIQFYARSAVLSLELPHAFHRMHNTVGIDNAICASSCNALRFITGDMRSVLLYQARLIGLSVSAWQFPILNWILFPFQILFAGQMIAEYHYASANVCERHRWINYKEYVELFLALGLLHQVGTSGLAFAASQFTLFLSMQFERLLGTVFLLSPMLQVLTDLPRPLYETFFGGILMFYFIGLTYYMPFPKTVKETERFFFDFGLRWLTETGMDFGIFSFKKMLKHRDESSGHLSFRQRLQSAHEWIVWAMKTINESPRAMSFLRNQSVRELALFVLPSMLRSQTSALTDPVLVLYTPRIFAEIKNILTSISSFHPIILSVVGMGKELDAIFSRSSVQWTLKGLSYFIPTIGFLLPKVGEMLTVDFIMHKAPKYLTDLLSLCNWLHTKNIIDNTIYDKYIRKLQGYEKNINLLKKVLNELPKSVIEDFLVWIGTEECRAWIAKSMITLNRVNDHLMKNNNQKLEALGFDSISYEQVELFEYDMPSSESVRHYMQEAVDRINAADSCVFPSAMTMQKTSTEELATRESQPALADWDDCASDVTCESDDDSVVVSNHRLQTDMQTPSQESLSQRRTATAWSARVFSTHRRSDAVFEPVAKTAYQF